MRLGTKILLLTLTLVVALTAAIVLIVRERVRSQELVRTPAEIHRAVAAYFARVDAAAENTQRVARLLLGDPSSRSDLDNLNRREETKERISAEAQFRDYLFTQVMPRELAITLPGGLKAEPVFHALFNDAGDRLLLVAPGDSELAAGIIAADVNWNTRGVLPDTGEGETVTQYIHVDSRLFLVIGVPVATSAQADEPPTNAYFVGYRVDDAWAGGFASSDSGAQFPLGVWFVTLGANGQDTVACGGDTRLFPDPLKSISAIRAAGMDLPVGLPPVARRIGAIFETFLAEVATFDVAPRSMEGETDLGTWKPTLVLAVTASLDRALEPMNRLLRTITLVGVGAVVIAFVACRFIASRISRPVRLLVKSADRIADGRFDVSLDTARKDEIGDLARGFEHMVAGLVQRDFIKDTFGKFVDPSVVAGLIEDPQRLRPGGEERVQTVLMSDIEGFTAFSEKLRPEQVVELLNAHLGASADIVTQERGVVDKFIGDAVVAFWGPPLTDDHAVRAARAALRMIEAARALAPRCAELGVPPLRVRIGIATGPVLVGNIGSASKFNYTVMGDTVNLCSRLEGLNKLYATSILCDESTAEYLRHAFAMRELDLVRVVGRASPTRVFEVLGTSDDIAAAGRCDAFNAARQMMLRREFTAARAAFGELARREGGSGASAAMAARCESLAASPPPNDWQGVFDAERK